MKYFLFILIIFVASCSPPEPGTEEWFKEKHKKLLEAVPDVNLTFEEFVEIFEPLEETDNSHLKINLIGTTAYGGKRVSCNEFMEIRIRFENYNLFKDGIPECQGEEVPNAWVESKNNLNRFEVTTCEIPCAIFQMPFVGALNGNNLGNIKGSQKIFIKDEIKTIKHGDDFADSSYRDWYSFVYNGDVYYITKLNFTKTI